MTDREWARFDADVSLGNAGPVKLTTDRPRADMRKRFADVRSLCG